MLRAAIASQALGSCLSATASCKVGPYPKGNRGTEVLWHGWEQNTGPLTWRAVLPPLSPIASSSTARWAQSALLLAALPLLTQTFLSPSPPHFFPTTGMDISAPQPCWSYMG